MTGPNLPMPNSFTKSAVFDLLTVALYRHRCSYLHDRRSHVLFLCSFYFPVVKEKDRHASLVKFGDGADIIIVA